MVSTGLWTPAPGTSQTSQCIYYCLKEKSTSSFCFCSFFYFCLPVWPWSTDHWPWNSCAFSQSINHGHTFPPWWGIARAITVASILHRKNGSSRSLKDLRTDAAPTVRNSELDLLNKHYFLQQSITASLRLPVCQMWEVGSWNPSLQASTTVSSEWVARSRGGVLPGGGAGRREPRGSSAERSHCL